MKTPTYRYIYVTDPSISDGQSQVGIYETNLPEANISIRRLFNDSKFKSQLNTHNHHRKTNALPPVDIYSLLYTIATTKEVSYSIESINSTIIKEPLWVIQILQK